MALDDDPQFHPQLRSQWRDWLAEHHAESPGVWVVTWRKASGRPGPTYDDLVEEALCFGWVDSVARGLDDDRTMLRFTPRGRGSLWAGTNKERVRRLTAAGLMSEAGLRAVEVAKGDGTWSALDDVENLVVPDDLAAALDALPPARENFDAFPRSARRALLEWLVRAKRPATRERRIAETARLAQRGERAGPAKPRPQG